jgi:hypothetical protein
MDDKEKEIIAYIEELLVTGERLSNIEYKLFDNHPGSGVFVVGGSHQFPAAQEEYFRWDSDCRILLNLLGEAGKPFAEEFEGSTYESAHLHSYLAPRKIGNLKAIKAAILKGRISIYPVKAGPNATKANRRPKAGRNIQIGTVIGAVQMDSPEANQRVNITADQRFGYVIEKLRAAVRDSDLGVFERDEIGHSLDRVKQLAHGASTEKSRQSAIDKLTLVEKMINVSEHLSKIALPLIMVLRSHFG